MIPQSLEDRIRARAFEIYQCRMETGQIVTIDRLGNEKEITEKDDWAQATEEIIKEYKKLE